MDRVSEIENKIAMNELSAAQVFTQMRQLINKNKQGYKMKYIKKPVVIEAYQITKEMLEAVMFGDNSLPNGLLFGSASSKDDKIRDWFGSVTTIHGQETRVTIGDWIITEPDGIHFYPCQPDIFAATYDKL